MSKNPYPSLHPDYIDRAIDAEAMGDDQHCVVMMMSIVLGTSYEEAYYMADDYGRKKAEGWYMEAALAILHSLGVRSMRRWRIRKPGTPKRLRKTHGRYTSKTIGKRLPRFTWAVVYCDHVAILREGELLDWSVGKTKRVEFVQRLERF